MTEAVNVTLVSSEPVEWFNKWKVTLDNGKTYQASGRIDHHDAIYDVGDITPEPENEEIKELIIDTVEGR